MRRQQIDGTPPIEVTWRSSSRARRLSLRVSRLDGSVTLTLPRGATVAEGEEFIKSREPWLRKHVGAVDSGRDITIGGTVPIEGDEIPIVAAERVRTARFEDNTILVRNDPERAGVRVMAVLKTLARDRLATATDRYANAIGRSYGRISLRDTRSRWGSCSSEGDLMYSWRLIMAPPEILDYVAAHEVAHLIEMNHSERFWAIVERIFPDHKECRRWLRKEGQALHRIRFGN